MSFADHQDFLPNEEEEIEIIYEMNKKERLMTEEKEREINKRIREMKERLRQESSKKISSYELANYFMQEIDALERYLKNTL